MLNANYQLKQSLTVGATGWQGNPNAAEVEKEYNGWKRKSKQELETHLADVRFRMQKHHTAVYNAIDAVPDLINQEAAAMRNLATLASNKATRKSSKESLDKAKDKVAKVSMKNQIRILMQRAQDYGESVSDSETSEEEKTPGPVAPHHRRRRRAYDEAVVAPRQRQAVYRPTPPIVQPASQQAINEQKADEPPVPYPAGLTAVEIARLDAWKGVNFQEFCYKEKYGYPKLQMLKAKGCPVPYVAPPDWYTGPEVDEQNAECASRLSSRQETPAERELRLQLAQNGIEDIRSIIPAITREGSPEGSGSDSDMSVTPAMDSMRVGG